MPTPRLSSALAALFQQVRARALPADADGLLLQRFAADRDEAAFEALVARHGPMVFGVCRRILGNVSDAEDAFQATFLVLVRRADSLAGRAILGDFLHGVARLTALKLRTTLARRRVKEQAVARPEATADEERNDRLHLLDDAVGRLPEKYRLPVVLCELEGRTRQEAAQLLGWPEGTVAGRLARARDMLARKLTPAGVVVTIPTVPAALLDATAKAVAVDALAAGVSEQVLTLAEEVGRSMGVTKLKVVGLVLVGVVGIALGATALTQVGGPVVYPPDVLEPAAPAPAHAGLDLHGDPLPPGAFGRLGTVRFRHAYHVQAVAFAGDGKMLASGGFGSVSLWDTATGKQLRLLKGDGSGWLYAVAFSPDKEHVAAGCGNDILVWHQATGKLVRTIKGHANVIHAIVYSADGKRLLSTGGKDARLWDAATGEELRRFAGHGGEVRALALSPDEKWLVTGADDKLIRVWDVESGRLLRDVAGHEQELYSVAVSRDGKRIASGAGDCTVRLWDAATGKEVRKHRGRQTVSCVAFSPDDTLLASADRDGVVRLDETATGRPRREIRQPDGAGKISFSPDGKTLATTGTESGGVYLWDVATGSELRRQPGHRGSVDRVTVSPDGKWIASVGREPRVQLWDAATTREAGQIDVPGGRNRAAAFSPDGAKMAVAADDGVRVWDVARKVALQTLDVEKTIGGLAFSPDGRALAGSGHDAAYVWDLNSSKQVHRLGGHVGWTPVVAYSADGRLLATGGVDGAVCLWDAATGKRLHQLVGDEREIAWLAFSGEHVLALRSRVRGKSAKQVLCVWRTADGHLVRSLEVESQHRPAVAMSRDGKAFAVASNDKVQVLELATGGERVAFTGHLGEITGVAFTPQGRTLVTSSSDSTLLLWDVTGRRDGDGLKAARLNREQLDGLWEELGSADGAKAGRAVWTLASAPTEAVGFLKEQLRPVPAADAKQIAKLLRDLDDDAFAVREQASAGLVALGEAVGPAVEKALAGTPSAEAKRRLERVRTEVCATGEGSGRKYRSARAVEVLEQVGGAEAREVLKRLATGVETAALTREAKAALRR